MPAEAAARLAVGGLRKLRNAGSSRPVHVVGVRAILHDKGGMRSQRRVDPSFGSRLPSRAQRWRHDCRVANARRRVADAFVPPPTCATQECARDVTCEDRDAMPLLLGRQAWWWQMCAHAGSARRVRVSLFSASHHTATPPPQLVLRRICVDSLRLSQAACSLAPNGPRHTPYIIARSPGGNVLNMALLCLAPDDCGPVSPGFVRREVFFSRSRRARWRVGAT